MYSTILFLDRPRHLRYDIQAVLDLDQMLEGGFTSIFALKADMSALQLILWAGLKHEDPTLMIGGEKGMGQIIYDSILYGVWTYELLIKQFTVQLVNDGWIMTERHEPKSKGDILSIRQYINTLEGFNFEFLQMHPKDFAALTPREVTKLIEHSRDESNHMTAMICSVYAACSGASKQGGGTWELSDFLPQKGPKRQTAEEMKQILLNMRW